MRKSASGYLVALGAVGLAVLLRWLADPYLGDNLPLVALYGGVAVAARFGGVGPGILAVIVGYLASHYLFIPPRHTLELSSVRDLIRTLAFFFTCAVIIAMGQAIRVGQRRFEELSQRQDRWFSRPPSMEQLRERLNPLDPAFLGFAGIALVLIVGAFSGAGNARRLDEHEQSVALTQQVIAELESLLSSVKDAESSQRTFLITGEAEHLEPYTDGTHRVHTQLERIEHMIADNPSQLARLSEVKRLTEERFAVLGQGIALAREGADAASSLVRSGADVALMNDVRSAVAEMQSEERRLLERRAEDSRRGLQITVTSIVVPAILGLVLLCVMLYMMQQRLSERRIAAHLAADQRERFRVTLASIGDAVITTDNEGCVTYLNPVAEAATGWSVAEASGVALTRVFRIVNEETRQSVDNPAIKALKEGRVVGLANHTILIRRNGSECPIDDSAAPIRDEDGTVTGCVLVFRDITERKAVEQRTAEIAATARFLASIVDSSEDAIIAVSLEGTIQTWNDAAERLYGYSASEAIGKPIAMLIPADRADEEDRLIARLLEGQRISHFYTVRLKKNGEALDVSLTISAVKDEHDQIIGTSKVVRDISEAKAAEKRIYGLMADLEEADRRKDEFLAILAHELRGPLAPIRHSLEIVKRAQGDNQLLQNASTTMDRQLTQMVRIVDDLLDVSRVTLNKLELRRERVALAEVLEQAIQHCRPFAESLGHSLIVDIDHAPMFVDGDPVRLAQVFGNLLQNAYKYTERGGSIWLTAKREDNEVRVTVKDTGLGIPPDLLPHIFDLFIQVERNLERAQGGLGIGLTLVKQLVSMHDGTVSATSDGPGRGSEFTVRLPIFVEVPEARPLVTSAPSETGTTPRKILVVDDNRDSVESLAMLLRMLGHSTHLAYDGLEAFESAERVRPELILLDLGLPKLNGYEACRKIREQEWGRAPFIVALSGWGQEADRRKSEEAGFDRHVVKPLEYSLLVDMLASLPDRTKDSTIHS